MRRRFITFSRIVHSGLVNFGRNASLAIAAIAVMVVTLTIVLFSVVTSVTMNHTIAQIADKINVSIYLNDNVTTAQRTGLMNSLKKLSQVKAVSYVSKDQALALYKAENAGNKDVLADGPRPNPALRPGRYPGSGRQPAAGVYTSRPG